MHEITRLKRLTDNNIIISHYKLCHFRGQTLGTYVTRNIEQCFTNNELLGDSRQTKSDI